MGGGGARHPIEARRAEIAHQGAVTRNPSSPLDGPSLSRSGVALGVAALVFERGHLRGGAILELVLWRRGL